MEQTAYGRAWISTRYGGDSTGQHRSIAMLKQGTGSFKRAKHIKVRFFWLRDLIDTGEVLLKYVCSGELVADILTKPVTGSKFGYLLKKLIGWSKD